MFKRSTKITSLIVAAASIATMVPAMAADVKKVEANDGTVYNAVAYKDGKYYIDGEVEDKDEAAYYVSNGKYTDLDDIDSGDDVYTYGEKYLEVDGGDYYLDLSTGKVTDDSVADDNQDDAESALRKSLKKDDPADRYTSKAYEDTLPTVSEINSNKFVEPYYEVEYDGYHIYTDIKGNYVDADYKIGKIRLNNDTVKDTDYDDNGFNLTLEHVDTLGQDKDYIYRVATLNFGNTTGASVELGNDVSTTSASVEVVQKISKASDGDIDDAKTPKTVSTYFLMNDEGEVKSLDDYDSFRIVNGKIVAYKLDGDKLKATAITLSSKKGLYYTDFSDGLDEDEVDDIGTDVDGNLWILQKGYVKKFNLDDDMDKVYKVDGSMSRMSVYDKENIIVWDEDDEVYSIIAGKATAEEETTTPAQAGWVQDSATGNWSYVKADGTKATGWFQSPTSYLWYYMDANGIMQKNGWIQDGGYWYFLDATGAMKTGWVYTGGAWYFLKPTNGNKGAMQTGWIQTGGKWYYCNASGAMLSNTTVGGYVLGADGAWIK